MTGPVTPLAGQAVFSFKDVDPAVFENIVGRTDGLQATPEGERGIAAKACSQLLPLIHRPAQGPQWHRARAVQSVRSRTRVASHSDSTTRRAGVKAALSSVAETGRLALAWWLICQSSKISAWHSAQASGPCARTRAGSWENGKLSIGTESSLFAGCELESTASPQPVSKKATMRAVSHRHAKFSLTRAHLAKGVFFLSCVNPLAPSGSCVQIASEDNPAMKLFRGLLLGILVAFAVLLTS